MGRYPTLIRESYCSNEMVLLSDIGRTLLEMSQASDIEDQEGQNLSKLFYAPNTTESVHSDFYFEKNIYPSWHEIRPYRGIRTENYKYIEYFNPNENTEPPFLDFPENWPFRKELYHLKNDPDEV